MKEVAIIGTQGVPAKYGGFETLVENLLGINCPDNIHYTVFCSSSDYKNKIQTYKEATLKYIPLHANGYQSILYDTVSMIRCIGKYDTLLILGVSGCIFLPILRLFYPKKIIVNIDGLEHRRNKWGKYTKKFLKLSEKIAIKYADIIITDNKGIQDYAKKEYRIDSEMIAYGGDHVLCDISDKETSNILNSYKLTKDEYSFSVCRIEPENNVHLILSAFEQSNKPLVFVGNWMANEYGKKLYEKYKNSTNIKLLSPIYDLKILNVFRSNCCFYLHGHSAGGTNPSLVEAMFFGKPILAFNVIYNKETTEYKANYFSNEAELIALLSKSSFDNNAKAMIEIAQRRYTWDTIAKAYTNLY